MFLVSAHRQVNETLGLWRETILTQQEYIDALDRERDKLHEENAILRGRMEEIQILLGVRRTRAYQTAIGGGDQAGR